MDAEHLESIKMKLLIAVPTYNEKENAPKLIIELHALGLDSDLLFVDDNSPDGTGPILDQLKNSYPRLHVMHRPGKQGIGSAHLAAIKWAYDNGYNSLITMDCDFTHPPESLPVLLAAAPGYDIVVASRYLQQNSLVGWNLYRKTLTHCGHFLTRLLLKMPYDATGGLRFYRLSVIPSYAWKTVSSTGYSFFFESLYVFFLNGFKVNQIPISLHARTYGHSKMDSSEISRSVKLLFKLFIETLLNRRRFDIVNSNRSKDKNKF
jgi:dolichol-phosphate mannosyltransferase